MKKALSLILALTLLFAMALPAAAETQTLTVVYSAPETTYTLTIPSSQAVTDNVHTNIGMVHVASSANFFNQHLTVACEISEFAGSTNKLVFPAYLAFLPEGAEEGDLSGNAHSDFRDGSSESSSVTEEAVPLVLNFYEVTGENGALADKAVSDTDGGPVQVNSLWAYVTLSGNRAPSDTYTATVTYTASVKPNS